MCRTKIQTIGQWIEDNNIDTSKPVDCSFKEITSLHGLPEDFNQHLNVMGNHLRTLEGLPEDFNSSLNCSLNQLINLNGIKSLNPRNLISDFSIHTVIREYIRLDLAHFL